MATKKKPPAPPIYLERQLIEQLMFGSGRVRRFTQDSPVLPDVWLEYAHDPANRSRPQKVDATDPAPPAHLLITPYKETSTGEVRRVLRERLDDRGHDRRVIYNQSTVAATLFFEDLIKDVIPMTDWWDRLNKRFDLAHLQNKEVQLKLAEAVRDPEHPKALPAKDGKEQRIPADVLWMIRVAGAIALAHKGKPLPPVFHEEQGPAKAKAEDWLPLVQALAELLKDVETGPRDARVHSISLNREATVTVSKSTLAVKADAARQLFNISCKDLRWAVIDSGVDALHPAFRKRTKDGPDKDKFQTRVYETYDFTLIGELLDPDRKDELPQRLKSRKISADLKNQLKEVRAALSTGRSIDWKVIAPLLRVPHDAQYVPPGNDHGTHVAGILAGNWLAKESDGVLEEDLIGVCPDLELYDLRVLDANGVGDEFTVMAALQFLRWLNSTNDYFAVHGANLSISIPHDVANYACGRTPVCDECERVIASGVVVVVAAGNKGYEADSSAYKQISITDPGNADQVITVGATHRFRPHTYGVSYFSSRGPTGDGRIKPDIVAPGEKITAPLPDAQYGLKDGTSMAAPHVSGAAALLMARHNELVGRPGRVKQILCDTATNLGRERYFQGAGMLDVLRALQSV